MNRSSSEDQTANGAVLSFSELETQLEVHDTCQGEVQFGESNRENCKAELTDSDTTSTGLLFGR